MPENLPDIAHLASLYVKAVKAGDSHGRTIAKDSARAVALSHSEAAFARSMAAFLDASEAV